MVIQVSAVQTEVLASSPQIVVPKPIPIGFDGEPINPFILHADWITSVDIDTTWRSDVTSALKTNHEDRRSLANRPSRVMTVTLTGLSSAQTHALTQAVSQYANGTFPVPLYCDQVILSSYEVQQGEGVLHGSTSLRRFFKGQRVVLLSPSAESTAHSQGNVQLATVKFVDRDKIVLTGEPDSAPQAGWLVLPCMDAQLMSRASGKMDTDSTVRFRMTFRESIGPETLPSIQPAHRFENLSDIVGYFEGVPILDLPPDWGQGFSIEIVRRTKQVGIGRSNVIDPQGEVQHRFPVRFVAPNRDSAWKVMRFFDGMKGRTGEFYLRHPNLDAWSFYSPSPFSSLQSANIQPVGSHEEIFYHYKHVMLIRADGSFIVREITDITDFSPARFALVWDDPLPDFDFVSIAPIHLCRFDSDVLKERWISDGAAQSLSTEIIETKVFDDVEANDSSGLHHVSAFSKLQLAAPQLWFDAARNAYQTRGVLGFIQANPWPSRYPFASRWIEARASLPTRLPDDLRDDHPYLNSLGPSAVARFIESWQNNNMSFMGVPDFSLSLHDPALDTRSPLDQKHLWSADDGWTLVLCCTPFSITAGQPATLVEVFNELGIPIFELTLAYAVAGGGGSNDAEVMIYENGSTQHRIPLTEQIFGVAETLLLVVRWDPATGRLHFHRNGDSLISGGFFSMPTILMPGGYTQSKWGSSAFGLTQNAGQLKDNWGIWGGISSIVNYRRALSTTEVNEVCTELAQTYGARWDDVTY